MFTETKFFYSYPCFVFFCRREGDAEYGGKTIDAIRHGDWKLLQNTPFSARELYNLKDDPTEQNNLISTHNTKFRELNALQRVHLQRSGAVPWQKK
jgi:arylsulfatase A-like enzyme